VQIRRDERDVLVGSEQRTLRGPAPRAGNLARTPSTGDHRPWRTHAVGPTLATPQTITFVKPQPPAPPTPTPTARPSTFRQCARRKAADRADARHRPFRSVVRRFIVDLLRGRQRRPDRGARKRRRRHRDRTRRRFCASLSPSGDRLAYIPRRQDRGSWTFARARAMRSAPRPAPTLVGWSKDGLVGGRGRHLHPGSERPENSSPPVPPPARVSAACRLAPDATHVVYRQDKNLFLLNVATAKSTQLGPGGGRFIAWSPGRVSPLLDQRSNRRFRRGWRVTIMATIPSGRGQLVDAGRDPRGRNEHKRRAVGAQTGEWVGAAGHLGSARGRRTAP